MSFPAANDRTILAEIGDRIRRRLDLNLAQQEVAERAHLPATQVERIAAGLCDFRNPDRGNAP